MSCRVTQGLDLSRYYRLSGFSHGVNGIQSGRTGIPIVASCRLPSSRGSVCHPAGRPDSS